MLAMGNIREILFGGAAGGAKSDALLMAALQYADTPGYNAIIFRKDFQRLEATLMSRAKQWLVPRGVSWNGDAKRFTFTSGATLRFGYLDSPDDRWRYQGTEYHFFGFDELTEFALPDDDNNVYLFMNRSARKAPPGVPIRFVSASNPGNIGHEAVRRRFITREAENGIRSGENRIYLTTEGRAFIPSRISDNPIIDEDEYRAGLAEMAIVTRERMMNGDWSIRNDTPIKPDWLRYFETRGDIVCLLAPDGTSTTTAVNAAQQCKRFATIDTAGTDRLKAEESRGKPASWSVIAIWDWWPAQRLLFLRHIWRQRVGWNELEATVPQILRAWNVRSVMIENAHFGPVLAAKLGAFQVILAGPVLPGMADGYRGAKYERAAASGLLVMLENGQVVLPQEQSTWRKAYESELLGWNGTSEETTDQIDVSSYAAYHCKTTGVSWGGTSLKR